MDAGIAPESIKTATFAKGKGCNYCQKKGYRGRIGIYELMHVTPKVRELIFANAPTQDIRTLAIEQGMRTLYTDGVRKAMRGVTTLEEVYRNAKRTEQDAIIV
jgi:type IV pilus assembly protein PilB